jgi:hypothetical protein
MPVGIALGGSHRSDINDNRAHGAAAGRVR